MGPLGGYGCKHLCYQWVQRGAQGLGGPAKLVELHFPHGVCLNSSGELFIVDTGNNRILRLVRETEPDRP